MSAEIILVGVVMGLAFAAPPGAVTTETFSRGVRDGFAFAFLVQLGSMIGDATYAILALAGLAALVENPALRIALGALGAMFLMYLAYQSFIAARAPIAITVSEPAAGGSRGAFLSGLVLSLTNPWAIAFWLSLGGALASIGHVNASLRQMSLFFASFMFGSAIWAAILSVAIARVRTWIRPTVFRLVCATCGLALGGLGLMAAGRVVSSVVGL